MNEILVKEVIDAVDVVFVLENGGELSDHFLIRLSSTASEFSIELPETGAKPSGAFLSRKNQ
jgi:hypothetical protein